MIDQSGSYATPRADIGAAIQEFRNEDVTNIGTQLLTVLPMKKKAASVTAVTREATLYRVDTKRAKRGAYNRAGFEKVDVPYECEEHGLEGPLEDSERSQYASDFDAEYETSRVTMGRVLREQEIRIAALVFNTTTWTGADLYTDVSAAPWDTTSSDAISHVIAAKEKVRRFTGMNPDTMAIGKVTYDNLKRNDDIVDMLKYVKVPTEDVIKEAMASIFGLKRILVGDNVYNATAEGGTISMSDVWSDDYAFIAVTAMGGNIIEPCVGRTVLWSDDSPENATVEEYREEQTRSTIYRVRQHTDEKIFDPYFAHLLKVDA